MVLNKQVKSDLRAKYSSDSKRLFEHIWRKLLSYNRQGDIDDIYALYDVMTSEVVNNPKSSFYIYG